MIISLGIWLQDKKGSKQVCLLFIKTEMHISEKKIREFIDTHTKFILMRKYRHSVWTNRLVYELKLILINYK